MEISEQKKKQYTLRLLTSRMRILCNNGFYGLLLMHAVFGLDESLDTAATDGRHIRFCPKFLDELSDSELDFVMMHEIMHIVLRHCQRTNDRDPELFNIACDIVVNSNILKSNDMKKSSITLAKYGESMHIAPNGKEGFEYTAEEVYEMLLSGGKGKRRPNKKSGMKGELWDNHSQWGSNVFDPNAPDNDDWDKYFEDACVAVEIREACTGRGTLPAFAERIWKEKKRAQTDWRTILNQFVQEDVADYTFSPPDKRFDGPFILPDFNDTDFAVADILFMIDTSSSISDNMLAVAFSEVQGAIEQFDGKLRGWLGFFDATVHSVTPFEDGLPSVRAIGGGGTDFAPIFGYVDKYMSNTPPKSIVILTDGYAPFPPESAANNIPVLWLINNDQVTPPWGKIARVTL